MKLNLFVPNVMIRIINLSDDNLVEDVAKRVKGTNVLVYKGMVLIDKLPLKFYDIKSGSCLVVLNKNNKDGINKWKNTTLKNVDFIKKMEGKNLAFKEFQSLKNRDLRYLKLDTHPKTFRGIIQNLNENNKSSLPFKKMKTIYEKPTSICKKELPSFW